MVLIKSYQKKWIIWGQELTENNLRKWRILSHSCSAMSRFSGFLIVKIQGCEALGVDSVGNWPHLTISIQTRKTSSYTPAIGLRYLLVYSHILVPWLQYSTAKPCQTRPWKEVSAKVITGWSLALLYCQSPSLFLVSTQTSSIEHVISSFFIIFNLWWYVKSRHIHTLFSLSSFWQILTLKRKEKKEFT
jgi:hypothetical protein